MPEKFREVLDCGSPLPLFPRRDWQRTSGRGLPQSKTLARRPINQIQLVGYSIFENAQFSGVPAGTRVNPAKREDEIENLRLYK
jgi:hypothetical protein